MMSPFWWGAPLVAVSPISFSKSSHHGVGGGLAVENLDHVDSLFVSLVADTDHVDSLIQDGEYAGLVGAAAAAPAFLAAGSLASVAGFLASSPSLGAAAVGLGTPP